MSIPFDEAVLTEYIQMHIDKQTQGSETTNRFKSKYKNLNGGKKANDQDTISSESFYDAMK